MKCPMYKSALLTQPNAYERIKEGDAECDRKECGQWDEKHGCCAIVTIAQLKISGLINTHPA